MDLLRHFPIAMCFLLPHFSYFAVYYVLYNKTRNS